MFLTEGPFTSQEFMIQFFIQLFNFPVGIFVKYFKISLHRILKIQK